MKSNDIMENLYILIGTILVYIASFGFSDYIVKEFKLEGRAYLIYYGIILVVGLFMIRSLPLFS